MSEKGQKIEKTQAEHPGQKVRPIDTHDRIEVRATSKHPTKKQGAICKVHPVIADKLMKRGFAEPMNKPTVKQ